MDVNGHNGHDGNHRGNRLLQALPRAEQDRLLNKLTPMSLSMKTVLFGPGQEISAVHCPVNGVVSLVTSLEDGAIVEVATVGNEGIVGVPLVHGGSLAVRAISPAPGVTLGVAASG